MENIILYFSTKGSLSDKVKAQVEAFITLMQNHTINSVGSNITLIHTCNGPVCCKRKNIGWFQTLRDFDGNLPTPIPDPSRTGHFMPLKERLFNEDKNIYMDKHLPSLKGNPTFCKECGRRILSKTDLTNHMRLVHSKKNLNECSNLSDTDDYDSEVELALR
ncbi:zinc finger protein [Acrasis kona]|uniref:Zinc finger protein n=1 Tax=Acrasis kona TaxID=1008807 RepID=A0AAW2ZQC7_9EUKA